MLRYYQDCCHSHQCVHVFNNELNAILMVGLTEHAAVIVQLLLQRHSLCHNCGFCHASSCALILTLCTLPVSCGGMSSLHR